MVDCTAFQAKNMVSVFIEIKYTCDYTSWYECTFFCKCTSFCECTAYCKCTSYSLKQKQ